MNEFIIKLYGYADWAEANQWEVPICLADDLKKAAHCIETYEEIINELEKLCAYGDKEINGR